MQQHTLRLTPPAGKPMPIVIPSYNGARKQANLTPLLAMLLHKLGFPVVVHGVSHDPTRVLTETIFTLLDIPATLHAGQAQAQLEGHEPVYIPVGGLLSRRWRNSWRCAGGWAYATAPIPWPSWPRRLAKGRHCVSPACRIRNMFPGGELLSRDRWPRAADAWYRGRSVRQPAALSADQPD
ncbi:anthranilate phosphoribosyltransferase like protein [Klebsiella pneumoniae]|nr:anthranilate phosphoribosyltransferase like protein [Klebsiella pneumoniae]